MVCPRGGSHKLICHTWTRTDSPTSLCWVCLSSVPSTNGWLRQSNRSMQPSVLYVRGDALLKRAGRRSSPCLLFRLEFITNNRNLVFIQTLKHLIAKLTIFSHVIHDQLSVQTFGDRDYWNCWAPITSVTGSDLSCTTHLHFCDTPCYVKNT